MKFKSPFTFLMLYLFSALSAMYSIVNSQNLRDLTSLISQDTLEDMFKGLQSTMQYRLDLEKKLSDNGRVFKPSDRESDISLNRNLYLDPIVRGLESNHLIFDEASSRLHEKFKLSLEEIANILPGFELSGEVCKSSLDSCNSAIKPKPCDIRAKYRTADGQCNNLLNPRWGMALSCKTRFLPAYYTGSSAMRQSVLGGPLPKPRFLSLNLGTNVDRPSNFLTFFFVFYSQFLDHDITLSPSSTTVNNQAIKCCPIQEETHPQCMPIEIEKDDPFYSKFNVTCLNLVRSAVCPTCSLGHRVPFNIVTTFIDASSIYGNSDNETASLRAYDGTGRLRIQRTYYGDLMPASKDPKNDYCSFVETNEICFQAGDSRANQHSVLTCLHTLFVREHNRLATELRQVNPHWDEETIFQEARRIMGAEMQVIAYKEYLPVAIGKERMEKFDLNVGNRTKYDPHLDPSIRLEFSGSAFRFGHTLINSVIAYNPLNGTNQLRLLRNDFFQPFDLYKGYLGPLMHGSSNAPAQGFDRYFVPDVTHYLYRVRGKKTGLDLASTDINRGRDHGLPPYVDLVWFCSEGQVYIQSFSDLVTYSLMKPEDADDLSKYYRDVRDIDLWAGMPREIPIPDGVVGPTVACVVGRQYNYIKFGDRFYFEHDNVEVKFTKEQVEALRKVSLSQIICLNTDVQQMSRNPFLFSSPENPIFNCMDARGVNLSYWQESTF